MIVIVVAIVALVVIGLIAAFARRSGKHSLPEESKQRYAQSWRAIEARFVDDPSAAVRDADQLVVAIMQERGSRVDEREMPKELRSAREAARQSEGQSGTEAMRHAMLEYQKIVDDAVGVANRKWAKEGRREVA
ncbi:MAG TPA: hypothetical protein VFL29_04425 [Candidatus Dormibacteraeota bacterium]|nr:hypothetical protein [Candidatus Dormibacteraeota bacterium]